MRLWALAFILLPLAGQIYVTWHVWQMFPTLLLKILGVTLTTLCFLLIFAAFLLKVDKMPMWASVTVYETGFSWIFILLYAVILFLVLDILRLTGVLPKTFLVDSWHGSAFVFLLMTGLFVCGYRHYMHKVRTEMTVRTDKPLARPLRVVLMSDLHVGYANRKGELQRWIRLVNEEHPDLVLIGGDIIDGSIRALKEQDIATEFRRLEAPVYACLGNHEYYAGMKESVAFYREAGIRLLRDEAVTVNGIRIVGRDDRTNGQRKSLSVLLPTGAADSLFTILLDHQPYHLEEAQAAGVDFQLSGHTHYGQVWPVSWIEDAMYEDAYGPLTKGATRYYVTSGIGIWGGKFRIGTRSEYMVLTITR